MAETNLTKNKEGYGYKYTDLAQIHEYLEKNNMAYYQYTETVDNKDYIMTVPIINGEEKEARRGVQIVGAVLNGAKNPAQEQGSATTYARRYSLLMAFGLATEDDDGASLGTQKTSSTNNEVKKATEKQIAILIENYEDENMEKLLKVNNIEKIEDMPMQKASELISKLYKK